MAWKIEHHFDCYSPWFVISDGYGKLQSVNEKQLSNHLHLFHWMWLRMVHCMSVSVFCRSTSVGKLCCWDNVRQHTAVTGKHLAVYGIHNGHLTVYGARHEAPYQRRTCRHKLMPEARPIGISPRGLLLPRNIASNAMWEFQALSKARRLVETDMQVWSWSAHDKQPLSSPMEPVIDRLSIDPGRFGPNGQLLLAHGEMGNFQTPRIIIGDMHWYTGLG